MSIVTKEGAPGGRQGKSSGHQGNSDGRQGNSNGNRSENAPPYPPLGELPAEELWRDSAPADLRSAWARGDESDAWTLLVKHLTKLAPIDIGEASMQEALLWGVDTGAELSRTITQLVGTKASQGQLAPQAEAWLDAARSVGIDGNSGRPNIELAMWSLAWAYATPAAAKELDAGLWWAVVDQLRAMVQAALEDRPGEDSPAEEALVDQLLAGEAALVLSALLPDVQPLRSLRKESTAALTEGVLALTDGEGLPPARCLPRLGMFFGCWTRCAAIADSTGRRCWGSAAETQYEWLVRQALRLSRPDGSFAFTSPTTASPKLLATALDLAGDEADEAAAADRIRPRIIDSSDEEGPDPSINSEWSGVSVLAAGWKPKSPRITVTYDGPTMQLEIAAGGQVLFSGDWTIDLAMEGGAVAVEGDWEEQCWFSDEDSDYLEVAIDLENGARLERQVFLAREDGVGYLAEVVRSKADRAVAIEVTSTLSMAEGTQFHPEQETREGWLVAGDQRLAGVVPLALPEWRVEERLGELQAGEKDLGLSQLVVGRNTCSPLMFDFKPRRFAKQRTWRQLTVAESLQKVAPDVAVGYRMQSGKDQWVVYRSLDAAANRTLIGGNYSSESLIGRFLPTGEVEEYWEVESE